MGRRFSLCLIVSVSLVASGLATALTAGSAGAATGRTPGSAAGNPFCKNLGVKYLASAGAQSFCFGAQRNGAAPALRSAAPTVSTNVNAANLAEDVSPSGVRAYGQSETSVAATGQYVIVPGRDLMDTTDTYTCFAASSGKELSSSKNATSFVKLPLPWPAVIPNSAM